MTVSQIRDLMMERVVPESLLPQNIPASLIDEDSAPPELDAFTFLNRLRSLGIGSADFLYLLKGCGAPDEAVEKIEQHPDMNLQSLIVTLDGSGLTPKDYTRMLYTARQLWERTITMRLEQEELRKAEEESLSEKAAEPVPQPEPEPEAPRTARQRKKSEPAAEPEKPLPRTARQKKKEQQEFRVYEGVKPIGRRNQPEEENEEPDIYTAVQLNLPPEADEETPAEPEEKPQEPVKEDDPRGRRSALIACAIGAAIVCAADFGVGLLGFARQETAVGDLHFAVDAPEVFGEIYEAYNSGLTGGNAQEMLPDVNVFGDLLIDGGEQLGVYSDGGMIWSAEPDNITVYTLSEGSAEVYAEIQPPEGAQFLRVVQTGSGTCAVFSGGGSCGIAGLGGDGKEWFSQQCGDLTDIFTDGGTVRLGSVYTLGFRESFTVDDVLSYMPWTASAGERTELQPAETAVTGTARGCGYAVNVEYSISGEVNSRMAVLGDPLYSGAEFFSAVLRQENGTLLVSLNGKGELTSSAVSTEVTAAACGSGLIAAAETSESGTTVYIRDREHETISAFSVGSGVTSMEFSGNTLLLGSDGKVDTAINVTEPGSPEPLTLTAAEGTVNGNYALCGSTSPGGITLTLYELKDGKAVMADSFSKTLSASELGTFRFCGRNTAVVSGTECSGAAYTWFDGVSVVSEFSEMGKSRNVKTMYDDRNGFTGAVYTDNGLVLLCGDKIY